MRLLCERPAWTAASAGSCWSHKTSSRTSRAPEVSPGCLSVSVCSSRSLQHALPGRPCCSCSRGRTWRLWAEGRCVSRTSPTNPANPLPGQSRHRWTPAPLVTGHERRSCGRGASGGCGPGGAACTARSPSRTAPSPCTRTPGLCARCWPRCGRPPACWWAACCDLRRSPARQLGCASHPLLTLVTKQPEHGHVPACRVPAGCLVRACWLSASGCHGSDKRAWSSLWGHDMQHSETLDDACRRAAALIF